MNIRWDKERVNTMSIEKSGACPVMPNTVVFR